MFPSQTSLIPVTIALTRFLTEFGAKAWGMNYPYWYLGSTPFKFLIGPVFPLLISLVHKLLPAMSLFSLAICTVISSLFLSALGWGILVNKVSESRKAGLAMGILLLFLPFRFLAALAFDEASMTIAKSSLPFVLIACWFFLKKFNLKHFLIGTGAVSALLLVNTNILPILLVGLVCLALVSSYQAGKFRHLWRYFKRLLVVVGCSLLIVTFWYSPGFWLVILTNPSIGGASSIKVIFRVLDLAKAAIPLVLALGAVYFSPKAKSRLAIFTWTWILTFLFLTAFRFIGDPDFWSDWTSWFFELEIGIALVIVQNRKYWLMIVLPFIAVFLLYRALGKPRLIVNQIPEGVASIVDLNRIAGKNLVFCSGTTVFWLNAFYDTPQVRGGRDEVSLNKDWLKTAYALRESQDAEIIKKNLESTKVRYVLVHSENSKEYYHDFKNTTVWDTVGKLYWTGGDDVIYSE